MLHQKQRPLAEMIFVTNLLGALILHAIAANSGEIALLQQRLTTHPTAILWLLATVVLAYGGSYAFTACIKGFGAVVATGVGICRKFVSVLASYTLFPKPFNVQHVFGIALFFAGMVLSWSQQASVKGSGGGKKAKQASRRKAEFAELQKAVAAAPGSDTSSAGADSDGGADSPIARTLLVATPYGTPGTPTPTVSRPLKACAHLDGRSAPKGPI